MESVFALVLHEKQLLARSRKLEEGSTLVPPKQSGPHTELRARQHERKSLVTFAAATNVSFQKKLSCLGSASVGIKGSLEPPCPPKAGGPNLV